ncbi:hypothetical protein ILYODFUR_038111 [Ilyodon furcidens]|uniref:Uncharacterized protein n=1 Tax=Ilyodon furcidens TaxID=33524 RepID=A0ABV0U438_9TELE
MHPAAAVKKPQGAAATSPQDQPAAVYTDADPDMDPETRDPVAHHPPNRGQTEPRGKHPLGVSRHIPKHLALDTENHQYTSGQRHQPPAVSVAGRKQALHLMRA